MRVPFFIPGTLVRFRHGSFWLGVCAPLAMLAVGLFKLLFYRDYLWGGFSLRRNLFSPVSISAMVALTSFSLSVHCRYFWGQVSPFCRFAPIVYWTLATIATLALVAFAYFQMRVRLG